MGWFTNLVMGMACMAGGLVVYPVQIADSGAGEQAGVTVSGVVRLVHLVSFATAFGTSVWASFIGGIIMFKNLPRHMFGNLQAKMFPAYFKLLIVCCSLCVSAMATTHPWKTATKREQLQIVALGVSLFTVVINLLVFQPLTVKIMMQRHKIEKEEGIGAEVGWSKNVEAAKKNPELAKINRTFGIQFLAFEMCIDPFDVRL
ncbi:hypothetical protein KC19_3G208300 [Ceratodon purpureus]|uniref:TMEM205-like domain-containing protein n=1 Tax=Ceratodon purpureus TaxID=3225 RepID=A0A8T0INL8_CERPU|nr:hypothetical protein KC19_3G208300 [Ceratodon purpureus]KAG0584421.1 hypothetical protein KC19_3G208300 [Ceratodon purpureus]KAG0584422.1 hypothetical protein KC19_3G208300 [Ceratodon purpureus]